MTSQVLEQAEHIDSGAAASAGTRSVYSPLVSLLVSALGGPLAAVTMAALDVRQLRRRAEDRWLVALTAGVALAGVLSSVLAAHLLAGSELARAGSAYLLRALALLTFLAFLLRHRTAVLAPDVARRSGARAVGAGALVIVAALVAQLALTLGVALLLRQWLPR
jgi:hypothetical protein